MKKLSTRPKLPKTRGRLNSAIAKTTGIHKDVVRKIVEANVDFINKKVSDDETVWVKVNPFFSLSYRPKMHSKYLYELKFKRVEGIHVRDEEVENAMWLRKKYINYINVRDKIPSAIRKDRLGNRYLHQECVKSARVSTAIKEIERCMEEFAPQTLFNKKQRTWKRYQD